MTKKIFGFAGMAGLILSNFAFSLPAHAQTTYGPWVETRDCRTQRAGPWYLPRGPQLSGSNQVNNGGYQQAQECRWERTVRSCPRLFRSLRECSERRERTGYRADRPRD